jgi:hypothetical protein
MITITMMVGNSGLSVAETPSDTKTIPDHAEKAFKQAMQKRMKNVDWTVTVSWNATHATVDYEGPADKNPYKLDSASTTSIIGEDKSVSTAAVSTQIQRAVAPTKSSTASGTAIWKETMTFSAKATNTNSNHYQVLNAMNSANTHWLQAGLVYDLNQLHGSQVWKMAYNVWKISDCSNTFFGAQQITVTAGDTIESSINAEASQSGTYVFAGTNISRNTGVLLGYSLAGDSGNTINLGQRTSSCSSAWPSGPMVEQKSAALFPTKYNFGTQVFTMGFYDTPTSSKTTSVSGWNSPVGASTCVNVSTTTSPAKATFTYNC